MTEVASSYTPELADLMEHEKVIEQGMASFIEVGNALMVIRDAKKYRAAGFRSFDAYCQERWGFTRSYADRQIVAARQVTPTGVTFDNERQARAARQVPKPDHPAPFSDPILATIARRVQGAESVLDPFAGTGRVHELRERAGVERTIGVEIEPEWAAKHPDTIEGNALDLDIADESVEVIATSPTYGNRMADHHDAKDDSTRLTYKHTLGRELHEDNSGALQWGDEYRAFHFKAWSEAIRVLTPGGRFVINVKDHIRNHEKQEVVAWHIDTLCREFGLELIAVDLVPTAGLPAGENAAVRVGAEVIATFRKVAA